MSQLFNSKLSFSPRESIRLKIYRVVFLFSICGAVVSCSTTTVTEESVPEPIPTVTYFCSDTTEIKISRSPNSVPPSVTLTIDGQSAVLKQGPAASGVKFSDGKLTWWERGTTGMVMLGNETIHRECRRIS